MPHSHSLCKHMPLAQFFFQLKGDMVLKVVEKGQHKDVVIKEGEVCWQVCRMATA